MPTNFPTSLDSFISPNANDSLNSPTVKHSNLHTDVNDAIEAIESKVGIDNSNVTSSLDYKVNHQVCVFRSHRSTTTVVQAQNLTRYYPLSGSLLALETDESLVQTKMPRAGRIISLRSIISNTVGGSGQTFTCTIRKNRTDTSLATVHNSGDTGIKEATGDVSFSAGDLISIGVVTSATTGNVNPVAHEVVVEFKSS